MKEEPKTVEQVEIEKQSGIEKANNGGLPNTDVEVAAMSAEESRIKTAEKATAKKE